MVQRLQVLFKELREFARRQCSTVAGRVRQTVRPARRSERSSDPDAKLAAVRAAARHGFPSGAIDQVLVEIESGYLGRPQH